MQVEKMKNLPLIVESAETQSFTSGYICLTSVFHSGNLSVIDYKIVS